MVTPVTSEGSRSGVNWMRLLEPCTVAASARAREVLPVPGASSNSTWPSASMAVKVSRMTCSLPSTACPTLATSFSNVPANHSACSMVMVIRCASFFGSCVGPSFSGPTGCEVVLVYLFGMPLGGLQPTFDVSQRSQLPLADPSLRWYQIPLGLFEVLYQT